MQKQSSSSPILIKYLKAYEQNPHSRVFAPLAETYRKMGMNDKAMRILRDGIKSNPDYVLGYLGLSFCYFDQGQFQLAYNTLRPFVNTNRDNLRLQKLFAQVCYRIGHLEEALETYKYILFINPRDEEAKERVSELEDNYVKTEVVDQIGPVVEDEDSDYFEIKDLSPRPMGMEEIKWVQKDLSEIETKDSEHKSEESSPVITHTLVDLYCAQGHFKKALELLNKLLTLDPKDQRTLNKIEEVKGLEGQIEEDEGHSDLMAAFDKSVGHEYLDRVQAKYDEFLGKVKSRAKKHSSLQP
ncbi:MAG: hypothetical protein OEY33_04140 [Bdellovibrionales bacterium]|jgi:pentatricopeptide repeat protein|nr:hypothetical protein [Bdellovibrionales bacterium]